VVGALLPVCSRPPHNRREDQHRQQKEHSRHFQPYFAANAAEGLEEAAEPTRDPAPGLARDTRLACNAFSARRAGPSGCRLCCAGSLRSFTHDDVSCRAPCDAQSYAQHSSYSLRPHSDSIPATKTCCRDPGYRLCNGRPVAGDPGYDGTSGRHSEASSHPIRRC
jgi:hypothetical protein